MKVYPGILTSVISRFPEKADTLTKLFNKDENFRELCEDYYLCMGAINKIIISNTQNRNIMREYKDALKELELEMLLYLNAKISINDD